MQLFRNWRLRKNPDKANYESVEAGTMVSLCESHGPFIHICHACKLEPQLKEIQVELDLEKLTHSIDLKMRKRHEKENEDLKIWEKHPIIKQFRELESQLKEAQEENIKIRAYYEDLDPINGIPQLKEEIIKLKDTVECYQLKNRLEVKMRNRLIKQLKDSDKRKD